MVSSPAVAAEKTGQGPTVNFRSGRKEPNKEAPAPEPSAAATPEQAAVPEPVPAATTPESGPAAEPPAATKPGPAAAPIPVNLAPLTPEGARPLVGPPETVWLDDELPAKARPEGTWVWDDGSFSSGARSHGHPAGEGLRSHGCEMEPVLIPVNGMITQQVWLDPNDPPKGISLQFRLATGEWIGVYWEGEQEVFRPSEEQELWYYGSLPAFGTWARLEVLAEDLGLEDEALSGLRFVTYDGRALWDRTALTEAPPIEEAEQVIAPAPDFRPQLGEQR